MCLNYSKISFHLENFLPSGLLVNFTSSCKPSLKRHSWRLVFIFLSWKYFLDAKEFTFQCTFQGFLEISLICLIELLAGEWKLSRMVVVFLFHFLWYNKHLKSISNFSTIIDDLKPVLVIYTEKKSLRRRKFSLVPVEKLFTSHRARSFFLVFFLSIVIVVTEQEHKKLIFPFAPLHKPLVFGCWVVLRQQVLTHHHCLKIDRSSIDWRRFHAQIEISWNRVISIHAIMCWQPSLITRKCRVLWPICCIDVRLIKFYNKRRDKSLLDSRWWWEAHWKLFFFFIALTLNLIKVSISVIIMTTTIDIVIDWITST